MKSWVKYSIFLLFSFVLAGCNDYKENEISYKNAKAMPGYGYIYFDFTKAKPIKNIKNRKTEYVIFYTNNKKPMFITVKDVDFSKKNFKAYVPYYKGYTLLSISSDLLLLDCKTCQSAPQHYQVKIYTLSAWDNAWCSENVYKNLETFDYTVGCKNDWRDKNGVNGTRVFLGSVYVTPYFYNNSTETFSNRLKSGHSSAGS